MISFRSRKLPRTVPAHAARSVLLDWVREIAPDLQIRKARLDDGRRACGAWFTFRGESFEVEAVQGPELPDPDDAIVRRCAWLLQRRLGHQAALPVGERMRLERAIIDAARAGRTEEADVLAHELAMANEGYVTRTPLVTTKFERFGDSPLSRR